ncbi:MAG: tandem-95 repeat protein [Planctomycetales bacterium]|nr:tandem-95 repeat protein [Planctomycetales bacterium]
MVLTGLAPAVTVDGLMSWYRAEGNANDSADGNNGSFVSGATTAASGMVGSAFSFSSTNNRVEIPDNSSLHLQAFTLDAWVYPTYVNTGDTLGGEIIAKQLNAGSSAVSVSILGPNYPDHRFTFAVSLANGDQPSFLSTSGFALNTWHHVAMTSNGTTVRGYVDGVLQSGSIGLSTSPIAYDLATPWTIGGHPGGSFGFANHYYGDGGLIDEVGIYQRGLSTGDVQSIYTQGTLGRYTIPGGQQFSLPGSFQDPDSSSWTANVDYGDGTGTQSLLLNPDHTFSLAHTYATAGVRTITASITDDLGNTTPHSLVVNVTTPTNTAPVASDDAWSVNEDATLNVAAAGVLANDVDAQGNVITASLVTGPSHGSLTLNADGSFSYSPAANYHGPDSFQYRAFDGSLYGNTATAAITVNSVPDAPVLASIGDRSVQQGTLLTFTATATDGDPEDTLTFSLQGNPGGAAIDPQTGVFTWTPNAAQAPGTYSLDVVVSDGTLIDSETISIEVTELPNLLPSITSLALDQSTIDENGIVALSGAVLDGDAGDTHTVTIDWRDGSALQVIGVNPETRTFNTTHQYLDDNPTATPSDSYAILVKATDNHGGTSSEDSISVVVNNVAPLVDPITGPTTGVRGQTLLFSGSFTDVGTQDSQVASWQTINSSSVVVASGSGTSFSFAPSVGGAYTVQLTVSDDDGGATTVSTSINVASVQLLPDPDRPGLTMLVAGGTTGNDTFTFTPTANAGEYALIVNGISQGAFAPTGSVQIYGGGGVDSLVLNGNNSANGFEVRSDSLVLNALPFFDHGIASRKINALGSGDTIAVFGGGASIDGGAAADTLVATGTVSHDWIITAQNSGSLDGLVFFSQVEQLIGGSGNDTFHFANGVGVGGTIDGGGGSDSLDYSAFSTSMSMNLQSGTATKTGGISSIESVTGGQAVDSLSGPDAVNSWISSGANAGSINGAFSYDSIENLIGGNQADTFVISGLTQISGNINGGGGADVLQYTNGANNLVNLGTHTASGLGGTFNSISQISFDSGSDTLVGPTANSTWTLNGNQSGAVAAVAFQNAENLIGAAATDTVRGPDLASLWTLTGADAGSLLGMNWNGMERLTGGSQADLFEVHAGGSLSGILNGGGGSDVLSYGVYGSPVTANLVTSSSTGISSFSSISTFVGSAAMDHFTAANTANTWTIDSINSGTVHGSSFINFETLHGGTAADTFRIAPAVVFAGTLDGGAGTDKLDYSAYATSVEVNLVQQTATGAGSVSGIEDITGGDGNDFLVGNSGGNVISGGDGDDVIMGWSGSDTLDGNTGRDLVIGGSGGDVVHGNNGEDILIAGTTTYASENSSIINRAAIDAIMAEWRRTDLAFAARVAHLNGSASGGLNGAWVLNNSTVDDDGTTDSLFGDASQDWFLTGSKDSSSASGGDAITFVQ